MLLKNLICAISRSNVLTPVCLPSLKFNLCCYYDKYGSSCSAPLPDTQGVHVAIKQAITLYSQTPSKCSVSCKSLRSHEQHSPEIWHFKIVWHFFFCNDWVRKISLKGAVACHQQTAKSCVKLCIFVSKISQVLHGYSQPLWSVSCSKEGLLVHPGHLATLALK